MSGTDVLDIDVDGYTDLPANLLAHVLMFTVCFEAERCSFLQQIRVVSSDEAVRRLLERAREEYRDARRSTEVALTAGSGVSTM